MRRHETEDEREPREAAPQPAPAPAAPAASVLALQRSAGNAAVAGQLLPSATARRMSSSFGQSFDDVRVHPDSPRALGRVQAVTQGRDVHFAAGAYRPGEAAGDWLIAHELAHVVQQSRGGTAAGGERDADQAADAVTSGQSARVRGGAPFGTEQRYEAWEHRDLGDAHGGAGRTVTLQCGITLSYGQVVALSGDFYRSPEALMRAPRGEIEKILAVMRREADQAHGSAEGAPSAEQVAENNADYEMATSGSTRAQHHSHSGEDGLLDDHEGHDHDDEHGLVVDGEHVEDAGPGAVHDVPSAEASFFGLADANASHFSPENIRDNFIPKHQLALDYAGVAFTERTGDPAIHESSEGTPGAAPSARAGDTPGGGPELAPDALDSSRAGPETPVGEARYEGGGPGERQEAMAWVSNGFADHYLTDAFAGGHLVSGNVGRTVGAAYFAANAEAVREAMRACLRADHPHLPEVLIDQVVNQYEGLIRENLPSLALKLVHDELNRAGVEVRNALGTHWRTVGDAMLASSDETRNQAELASLASRQAVQEMLDEGAAMAPFAALDHIPDVARVGEGAFRPIAEFAEDPDTFTPILDARLLSTDPEENRFYAMMKANTGPMLKLKARQFGRTAWNWVGEKAASIKDSVLGGIRGAWDATGGRVLGWGQEQGRRMLSAGEEAVEDAGEAIEPYVDSVEETVGEVVDDAAGIADRARRALGTFADWGEEQVDAAGEALGDVADSAKEAADAAGEAIGDAVDSASEVAAPYVDAAGDAVAPYAEAAGRELSELGEELSEWAGPVVTAGEELTEEASDAAGSVSETVGGWWRSLKSTGNSFLDRARALAARGVAEGMDLKDRLLSAGEGERASGSRRVNALGRHTYAHGGFMGAAGAFMADPEWRAIFARLMPADYRQAERISDVRELMQFLENNPVLNAYGSTRHQEQGGGQTAPLPLEWDVWLPPTVGPDLDLAEVKIAHGNKGTTVAQRVAGDDPIGLARADVADRPNASAWMELFGQAVALHRGGETEQPLDVADEFLGAEGGLILDVKSSYSTAADVATFVGVLRGRGINVIGVGTFAPAQLEAVPEGVRRVRFFNGVNGLETAAGRGELEAGTDVMFNAGALLDEEDGAWTVDREAFQRVVAAKQANDVHVGLYVQESDVSPQAVEVIIDLVNSHPDVFDRGFAYGNVGRTAETETEGSGLGDQAALDALDWVSAP